MPDRTAVEVIPAHAEEIEGLAAIDAELLTRHARYDCLSLVVRSSQGVFPFVLQQMRIRGGFAPPAMRLIYCRDVAEYVACAGSIGRQLLRRGKLSVVVDSNGPIAGLRGFYTARGRKYFKGPRCPRLADLTDTELVFFGP